MTKAKMIEVIEANETLLTNLEGYTMDEVFAALPSQDERYGTDEGILDVLLEVDYK